MLAKQTTIKNEWKMISLVDQGMNGLRTGKHINRDARVCLAGFEYVEPLELGPPVSSSKPRMNEIFLLIQHLAHPFSRHYAKLINRVTSQFQAAQIRPSPWY